jgi:hypothetical protein
MDPEPGSRSREFPRWWGKLWENLKDGFSVRMCRYVFYAVGSGSSVYCATLCRAVYPGQCPCGAVDRKSCHLSLSLRYHPKTFISCEPHFEPDKSIEDEQCAIAAHIATGVVYRRFPWLSDDGCWLWAVTFCVRPSRNLGIVGRGCRRTAKVSAVRRHPSKKKIMIM